MSKGYHRIAADLPWDNRYVGGYPPPMHKGAVFAARELTEHETETLSRLIDEPEHAVAAAEFEPGPPKMTRDQATSAGFTGNSCIECGSMQMVRNGTCEKCNSCGATTGCS